jgi:hypothetical protein
MSNIRCKLKAFAIATATASSLAAFLAAQPVMAFVLRGTLTDITFDNRLDPTVTANGSFDYDTVADSYSNINIAMSDGVTFTSTDIFTGSSTFFLIQNSSRSASLSLAFFTALTAVTPPDFVGLISGSNSGTASCLVGGSCYAVLGSSSTFRPSFPEESIDVTEVPAPPALVGTVLAGVFGLGSRRRKKQLR